MRLHTLLVLAPALFALTACHSNGGYLSADPSLTYGPGVVEFPEPARVYMQQYRRDAVGMSAGDAMLEYGAPVATYVAPARAERVRTVSTRSDPSSFVVRTPAPRIEPAAPPRMLRSANADLARGRAMGDALVLDRPVAPTMADIRVRGDRMPEHMMPRGGGTVIQPPKGAPLPAPTSDRPFRETELVVTPGGVYTR